MSLLSPTSLAPLLDGLLLGLAAAAPIGPVNVEIARRTLRDGRAAGFALGCGAVTVDVAYAIVTSLALTPVLRYPRITTALSIAAALLLTYLGVACLRAALRPRATDADGSQREGNNPPLTRHYVTGLLLTALNPMTLAFWFVAVPGAVATPAAAASTTVPPRPTLALVSVGVFAGAFAWVCFFTTLIARLRHFGRERWIAWIDLAGGVTLLTFAARAIWRIADSTL